MSQTTRRQVSEQVNSFCDAKALPFHDVLDAAMVEQALDAEGVRFNESTYTPFVTLCAFLSQVLDPDHSCRGAVAKLIVWLILCGRKPCSPETGTYCEARKRLPLGVVVRLVRQTGQELEGRAAEGWLWKGRHVSLVDGTTASMPDTPENQTAFPQSKTQGIGLGFPLVRLVAIISLASGAVRDLALGPYQGKETGETALFRTLWDGLEAGEIVLGDRCFASFFGIAGLTARGVDGLFRMHQRRKFDFRRGRRLGVEDHVVTWAKPARPEWMDDDTYVQIPETLTVREFRVKVEQDGFRVDELVLVTTMLDAAGYTKEELADLFLKRWNIELDLRAIKCVLQMDVLRCKTPEMVRKEIGMTLAAYNVVRALMARAAKEHDRIPRRLSFKGALQSLLGFAEKLRESSAEKRDWLWEIILGGIANDEVGNRPDRIEPRARKRRPKPYPLLTKPRKQARDALRKAS